MNVAKIGVLVSGESKGTNFQAILDAIERGDLSARVALLVSTNEGHGAVARARDANIRTFILSPKDLSREEWDSRVADALYEEGVSIIALAGYLRFVGSTLLDAFPGRILNVHPSLLPSFGGKGMFGPRVHRAVLEHGCKVSGCTVHLLDERYDGGPIMEQASVVVAEDETPDSLALKVQKEEHRIYPRCLQAMIENRISVEGRRVIWRKREG